jgi:hypothetical protein
MASKNTLLGSGVIVEESKVEVEMDKLPSVALPTWMQHKKLKSKVVNTKEEYYAAIKEEFFMADHE